MIVVDTNIIVTFCRPCGTEDAGYVAIAKKFRGKKPHTMIGLTDEGRAAFQSYKRRMQQILDDLPD